MEERQPIWKEDKVSYQYFSHEIDSETHFCVGCGRFLMDLQENQKWEGNKVLPVCFEASNVLAISHIVRNQGHNSRSVDKMRPVSYGR